VSQEEEVIIVELPKPESLLEAVEIAVSNLHVSLGSFSSITEILTDFMFRKSTVFCLL